MNRIRPRSVAVACLVASLAMATSACGRQGEDEPAAATTTTAAGPTVEITSPSTGTSVRGNVVTLALKLDGLSVVAADGDTSGKTGHTHVFVDREPVAAGTAIPKEPGIIHTVDNPVRLTGLSVGKHDISVVLGDGAHTRIGTAEDRLSVMVEGPAIDATAPTVTAAGAPVRIDFKVTGIQIVKADGDTSGKTGHIHVFVDKPLPVAGQPIPKPDDGSIIHTTESFVAIPNLASGEHTFFIVLGDGAHTPIDPPVADKVTVRVG